MDKIPQRTYGKQVISSNKSRYKPGCKDRAVDKRADALPKEYLVKAQEADRKYNGVQLVVVGVVEQKLRGHWQYLPLGVA